MSASRAGAIAGEFNLVSRRAQFARFGDTGRRADAPACPGRAGFRQRTHQQTARTIAFSKQEQPARGLEGERFTAHRERADHDRTRCRKPLLGSPQRLLSLARTHDNELARVETELDQARRVWRAILSKQTLLPGPDDPRRSGPASGEPQGKPKRRGFRSRPGGAKLMQRRTRHLGGESAKAGRREGGWTRTHVPFMF